MKLEIEISRVEKVTAGDSTKLEKGTLSVNIDQMEALLAKDARLEKVRVELANPGEKCRILRIADVIEPRAKVGESGQEYPGAIDTKMTVGHGRTRVLRGAAVILSEHRLSQDKGRPATGIIDMWGDGAETGSYGKTCNIVVMAEPAAGVAHDEYRIALKTAGLKASAYLAGAAGGAEPDSTEIFDIPSLAEFNNVLPRVTYIFQILTNQFEPMPGDPVLYGNNIKEIVPTVLHPNEILDGAVTAPYSSMFMDTYEIQNHPIVLELYREHGKSLNFCGVIISNAPNNAPEYERTATIAANLAKWTLKADGAILTKCGGGAPELVMARTAQKCEQLGIKTALALLHMGIDTTEISLKASTIFSDIPELDAMISMGAPESSPLVHLETAERIIGAPFSKNVETMQVRQIKGSLSQTGSSKLTAVRY